MGTDKYLIREKMEEIVSVRHEDFSRELKLCQELYAIACQENDEYAMAYSRLYMSDAYLSLGNILKSIELGTEGKSIQKKNEYYDLLVMQYNLLGVAYKYFGDYRSSFESYFKGILYAKKKNDYIMIGALHSNLASLYLAMGAIDKAQTAFEEAFLEAQKATENKGGVNYSQEVHFANMAYVFFAKKEYVLAYNYLKKSKQSNMTKMNFSISNDILEAKCLIELGKDSKGFKIILEVIDLLQESKDNFFVFDSWMEIFNIVIRLKKGEKAKLVLDCLSKVAESIDMPVRWVEYYECMVRYAKLINNREILLEGYKGFYYWDKKREKVLEENHFAGIRDKIALYEVAAQTEEIKHKNDILRYMAEVDELTQVANRYTLERYSEGFCNRAKKERTTLCVAIFDVDYFKEYNDRYGHIEGDKCLKNVAEIIATTFGSESLCGRYGGDEFVAIATGFNSDEIEAIIRKIQDRVYECKMFNEESHVSKYVSLSIGVINVRPEMNKTIKYYLDLADKELYNVKKNGKNAYGFMNEAKMGRIYNV